MNPICMLRFIDVPTSRPAIYCRGVKRACAGVFLSIENENENENENEDEDDPHRPSSAFPVQDRPAW